MATWGLGLLTGLPALAQGLRDAQIFDTRGTRHYGGGVRPNQGFFFVYDGLYWTSLAPQKATFGVDTNSWRCQRERVGGRRQSDRHGRPKEARWTPVAYQSIWMMGQRMSSARSTSTSVGCSATSSSTGSRRSTATVGSRPTSTTRTGE